MMRHLAIVASLAFATAGCGGPTTSGDAEETDLVALDAKTDAAAAIPTGTFELSQGAPGSFAELVLRADLGFRRTSLTECGGRFTCDPIQVAGRYRTLRSRSSGRTYVKFYTVDGRLLDTFTFLATAHAPKDPIATTMHLHQIGGDHLDFTMVRYNDALAHEGEQCGGFVANARRCAPGLSCVARSHTPDLPGTCEQ